MLRQTGLGVWGSAVAFLGVWPAPWLAAQEPERLEEIVVTAQRREQSLQDVPVAVTAISSEELSQRGITDYSTYLTSVPGAGMQDTTGIGGEIKFRGIGTGVNAQLSPTTAVYLGDVPIIHTGRNVNSSYDFWLIDLARVEVLRGPQGQLYGSNSLGGAIKNVPQRAKLGEFEGQGEVSGGGMSGGSADWHVSGMLNLPTGDDFAVRLVGYRVRRGGWYDNAYPGGPRLGSLPVLPPGAPGSLLPLIFAYQPAAANYANPAPSRTADVNTIDTTGGRIMLEWRVTDRLRAMIMGAHESKDYGGAAFAEYPNPGTFPPFVAVPNIDWRNYQHQQGTTAGGGDRISLANLVLDYDFGPATLTSSSSWWRRDERLDLDLSIAAFPITGVPKSVPLINQRSDQPSVLTQEVRLTSTNGGAFDWLLGLFWQKIDQHHTILSTDESGLDLQYWWQVALAQVTGRPAPATRVPADNRGHFVDEQRAVFGQLGYHITPAVRAAFSFRYFGLDQRFSQTSQGFEFAFADNYQSGTHTDHVFTPRAELSFEPQKGTLVYASASEGFRTGIINRAVPQSLCGQELAGAGFPNGLPPTKADTVRNYEVGTKLTLLDERMQLNAAAYRADWRDMQMDVALSAFSPIPALSLCSYDGVINAGDARSQGVELETSVLLMRGLRAEVSASYTDATFRDSIPQLNIAPGDPIPFTPKTNGMLALQSDFTAAAHKAFARVEWQYVGKKEPLRLDFPVSQYPQGVPFTIGDYSQVNLRAGIDLTSHLNLSVYAENLFDTYGITSTATTGGLGYPFITTIRPRSYGATFQVRF